MRHAYDLIVVGSGIVGLSIALAAVERRWRVLVVDRESRPIGASIRNFGFITVTGQRAGQTWERARRTAERWLEICPQAGIPILQRGLMLAIREPLSEPVIDAFLATPMGERLEALDRIEACRRVPALVGAGLRCAVFSPHELRIEPRTAVGSLAAWLRDARGVNFLHETAVHQVSENTLASSRGMLFADRIAVCPGPDLHTLFPEAFESRQVTLCKLQMMRVISRSSGSLKHPVMGDLSLVRYAGYAELGPAQALRTHLESTCRSALDNGVHIIAVQSADGSWVIGDSHHYEASPDPFQDDRVDRLIMEHAGRLVDLDRASIIERWVGVYPSGATDAFIESPAPGVKLVSVTSGTGMSTGLAIAEETVAGWD
jgi:FAD dependent oxidoreductase TIGR03364